MTRKAKTAAAKAKSRRAAGKSDGTTVLLRQLALAAAAARAYAWLWEIGSDRLRWMTPPEGLLGPRPASGDYPDFREMVHPSDRSRFLASGRAALKALSRTRRAVPYECAFRLVRTDGEVRTCLARGRAEADRAGRPVRMIGVTVDVHGQAIERALRRRAESRLAAFLDLAADWFMETDASLRVRFVSESAQSRSPIAPADLLGRALWELPAVNLSQDDRARLRAQLENRESLRGLLLEVPPGGRWVSLSAEPASSASAAFSGYLVVARDLTPEVAARRAAEEANARLQIALDAAGALQWEADAAGALRVRGDASRVLGERSRVPAHIDELAELIHPEDAPRERLARIAALKGEAAQYAVEYRYRAARGWRRIFSLGRVTERDPASGRACGMAGVILDVTRMRETEARLAEFLSVTGEGIFYFTHADPLPVTMPREDQVERILATARLAQSNPAHARIYGVADPAALVGEPLERFGGREANRALVERFVRSNYRVENALWSETVAGDVRWFRGSIYGIVEDGELLGAWGLQRDVTEEERASQLLRVQRDLLSLAAQGADTDAFIRVMLEGAQALVPQTIPSFVLLDESGTRIAKSFGPGLDEDYHRAVTSLEIGPKAGSCGTAIWRRERVVVTDIDTDPLWEGGREVARARGLRACWSQPVMDSTGRVLGTFALYARAARGPSGWETAVVEALAPLAATAL
ncbi:MAG: PAS domain-containing protein, partial [Burkholderiales bacterium]|nr:PAS domain-containing protein [Burkholderiales bacterium]